MTEGPDRLILSPCTSGDIASVAGLAWARRLEDKNKVEATVSVTAVAVGLLIFFLVLNLAWRVS